MTRIDLPTFTLDTTLGEALKQLSARGVSGLLVKVGGRWLLLDQKNLTLTKRRQTDVQLSNDMALAEVIGLRAPTRVSAAPRRTAGISGVARRPASSDDAAGQVSKISLAPRRRTPLDDAAGARRTLVVQDASLARSLTTGIRYCTCPDGHVWAPGEMATPGICNYDLKPVDCN